jgi:hypothetical protein
VYGLSLFFVILVGYSLIRIVLLSFAFASNHFLPLSEDFLWKLNKPMVKTAFVSWLSLYGKNDLNALNDFNYDVRLFTIVSCCIDTLDEKQLIIVIKFFTKLKTSDI